MIRRGRSPLAAAVLLPVAVAALPAAGSHAEEMSMTKSKRTAAPATCLLPSRNSPLVTLRIQLAAGSIDDPPGKEGLSALTALTIGQGGTAGLTYRQVTEALFPMAASIAPQPDREVTTFVGEVHRDHLQAFYALLRDLILKPRFDQADFARNRDLLLSSIETTLRGSDDENLGKAGLEWLMYRGHPYGRQCESGTVEGLRAITLEDVKRFHAAHYTRDGLLIGLAGGYPASFADTVRKDFAVLPEGAAKPSGAAKTGPAGGGGGPAPSGGRAPLPAPRPLEATDILIIEKPALATAISIGYPIDVTRADPDFYALMVARSYLGEHRTFTGRLMNVMRELRGLNYGDYAYIENFVQDGGSTYALPNIPRRQQHFEIWIRPVRPENAPFALRQAVRELDRLVRTGLTPQEFENTRNYVLNYSRLWAQSQSRRLGTLMDARFYGFDDYLERVQKELKRLTVERVNAAVRAHLRSDRLAVAMVTGKADALKEALLSGRPTPIVYQTPTTDETLLREDEAIASFPLRIDPARVRIVPARDMFER
jgi:zinc protease